MKNPIPDLEQRIIYEDHSILIFDKPYNIPTTGKTLADDDCVQFWLMKRQEEMIWAIHQLDADTTGINIFVKKKRLVKVYKEYLSMPGSIKQYLAIVHGKPEWDEIDERSGIGYVDDKNLGVSENGKTAHSNFKVLDSNGQFSVIQARITTGRTHQIRIHLSHLGHPIVGEEWYCNPPCKLHVRQALHAWKLFLDSQPPQEYIAPIPDDFSVVAKATSLVIRNWSKGPKV